MELEYWLSDLSNSIFAVDHRLRETNSALKVHDGLKIATNARHGGDGHSLRSTDPSHDAGAGARARPSDPSTRRNRPKNRAVGRRVPDLHLLHLWRLHLRRLDLCRHRGADDRPSRHLDAVRPAIHTRTGPDLSRPRVAVLCPLPRRRRILVEFALHLAAARGGGAGGSAGPYQGMGEELGLGGHSCLDLVTPAAGDSVLVSVAGSGGVRWRGGLGGGRVLVVGCGVCSGAVWIPVRVSFDGNCMPMRAGCFC
ncbi:hypothetical protein B0T19DRAFT_288798 [Cercophora scortea]|uniref:Uncharacterized protein n=1 Tax=Cercophora scortea TaxID=314031 RepID=A0AAE0I2N7_9PEZI|nr:hypothetical protein B0T19DRAFT_288798 [Cercophora scortea]